MKTYVHFHSGTWWQLTECLPGYIWKVRWWPYRSSPVWPTGDTDCCQLPRWQFHCPGVGLCMRQVTPAAGIGSVGCWCCVPPAVYCTRPSWQWAAADSRSLLLHCWSQTCRWPDSCGCWCMVPQSRRTAAASVSTAASTWGPTGKWEYDQGYVRGVSGCHSPLPSPPTGDWRHWSDSSHRTTCWCSRPYDTAAAAGLEDTIGFLIVLSQQTLHC